MEAGFRYRIIAPLTDPDASKSELMVVRRAIVRQTHEHPTRGWVKVSPRTVRRWLEKYRQDGMNGLMPTVHDQMGPRHLTEKALTRLAEIIRENPLRNTPSLLEDLAAEFPDLAGKVAPSTLNRHLHARGVCRLLHPERVATPPFKAFETSINDLFHSDVHYGPDAYDEHGEMISTRIICWLEGCTRVCCHIQAYPKDDFLALMRAFQPALRKFGIPRRTLTDHGSIYSGLQFALVCGDLGIIPLQTAVKSPWQNGKQERLWGSAESGVFSELRLLPPISLQRLNEYLKAWVEGTYHVRRHSVTQQPPLAHWKALMPASEVRRPTEDQLKRLFWFWERRTVSSTSIVQLFSNKYFVDPQLATKRVIVRYNPEDLGAVQIWSCGKDHHLLCEATAQPLLVQRRENPPPPPDIRPKPPSVAAQRRLDALEARYQAVLAREAGLIQFNTQEEL
jgi:hypothetical protein